MVQSLLEFSSVKESSVDVGREFGCHSGDSVADPGPLVDCLIGTKRCYQSDHSLSALVLPKETSAISQPEQKQA